MSLLGYVYIVSGTPFIKPHVASSVSEAYRFVESIKPKKSKIKCSEKELISIYVGRDEHLEILVDTKIDNKKILIYLFKTKQHSFDERNENNVKKIWKTKIDQKKDEKIILGLAKEFSEKAKNTKEQNRIKAAQKREKYALETSTQKIIERALNLRLDLADKKEKKIKEKMSSKEAYSRARNLILDQYEDFPMKKTIKKEESSLEIVSRALKLRTELARKKEKLLKEKELSSKKKKSIKKNHKKTAKY